ncbi:MAG: 30S ribosomal protein THX [Gammaproteobacteria bacterium]
MGKGDKKTARGKIWRGSYGKSRPHHIKTRSAAVAGGFAKKKRVSGKSG